MVTSYIAHSFSLRHYVRDVVMDKLLQIGIEPVNPFYNKDKTSSRIEVKIADEMTKHGVDPRKATDWMKQVRNHNKKIVENDLKMIDKCDILIAFMHNATPGTICEMFYMGVIKKKPVYLVTTNYPEIYDHPWINYACKYGGVYRDLETLIVKLKRKYNAKTL